MEKIDLKKLDAAIEYVQRIADGHDPVCNTETACDSVLNNPNVIRCMYFVKEVLLAVRRNDGAVGGTAPKAKKEPFPYEILQEFQKFQVKIKSMSISADTDQKHIVK